MAIRRALPQVHRLHGSAKIVCEIDADLGGVAQPLGVIAAELASVSPEELIAATAT